MDSYLLQLERRDFRLNIDLKKPPVRTLNEPGPQKTDPEFERLIVGLLNQSGAAPRVLCSGCKKLLPPGQYTCHIH